MILTLLGRDDASMVRLKFSFPSDVTSSIIGTSNVTLVLPAGNVTVYGPDL